MNGKSKCKILKDIRRQIAQNNDIDFVTSECKYQGDCTGTCPKCEAEVRYLEQELAKRHVAGKAVAVAGIATALIIGAAGCGMDVPTTTDATPSSTQQRETETSTTSPQTDPTLPELMGEPAIADPSTPTDPTQDQLTGDIAIDEEFTYTPEDVWMPGGAVVLDP